MNDIRVGTSGWTYDDWNGPFYPDKIKSADRLSFYAERFNTVEVNATFYRFPTQNMVKAWNRRLDKSFDLVAKGHRVITHRKKLRDIEKTLSDFCDRVGELKRLTALLWQLPPNLSADPERLEGFLALLPKKFRHAVEFRHPSWWETDETDAVLKRHNCAFVAVSHPELPDAVKDTADFIYARFHGKSSDLYRYDYSDDELRHWADKLGVYLSQKTVYAFFNNDAEANAPKNARLFADLLNHHQHD